MGNLWHSFNLNPGILATTEPDNASITRDYMYSINFLPLTATFTGLEAATYDVYVMIGNNGGANDQLRTWEVGFSVGETLQTTLPIGPLSGNDNTIWNSGVNYVKYQATLAEGQSLMITSTPVAIQWGTLNAIQIVKIPEAAEPFSLTITPATAPATGFDLAWVSQAGNFYNLRTSTDLAGPIANWDLVEGNIAATPPTNAFQVAPTDASRFYAVEEFAAPPPPPFFATGFEADAAGFTVITTQGSAWERGTPDSDNGASPPSDLVLTTGNGGSANAWGTNLGTVGEGFYINPTTTVLRSPVIDLTDKTFANLTFAEAVDFATTDSAQVYVISDSDDSVVAGPIHTSSTGASRTANWATANGGNAIALPAAALGRSIRLEWRFTGGTAAYLGWYIDDVEVAGQ